MPRLAVAAAVALTLVGVMSIQGTASADVHDWRKEQGEEHGSQVASSEWLPIFIGASGGVIVGAVTGAAVDDHQPPLFGGIAGGVIGGFTGGAAGSWLIRSVRDRDASVSGTLTGLGVGAGLGLVMFAKMDPDGRALETVGRWGALVFFPAVGAAIGHKLAVTWGPTPKKDAAPAPPPAAFVPVVAPVIGAHGATGMSVGIDAIF